MVQEHVPLKNGWSITIDWLAASPDDLPERVRTITIWSPPSDGGTGWKGPPPPLLADSDVRDQSLCPGLDIDVHWTVVDGPLGTFHWTQVFRDGLETAGPGRGGALQIRLRVTYVQLLRLLYGQEPFEEVLGAHLVAANFSAYSCVTGLIHVDGAPRASAYPPRVLQAVLEWAMRS